MNEKIMVVDDEKGVVTIMKKYFEMSGYQVITAYSGQEALKKMSCLPDIVLLDINMPDMDGLTVCQSIREYIDTVEYNGVTYLAFIPAEISIEEDAEVVIMQIVEENGEELLEAVEDDEIADAVFNIVMERAEAEEE